MDEVTEHNESIGEGTPGVETPLNNRTLAETMQDFYEFLLVDKERAKTTAGLRKRIMRRVLRDLGTLHPTGEQVDKFRRTLSLDGRSSDHLRNYVWAARDYFDYLGLADEVEKVRVPRKAGRKVPRYLTEDEVRAFLAVIEDARDRALFYFLAFTGLRVHEVLKVRPEDLDLDTRTLFVKGKGGKDAHIPIGPPAIPVLAEYMEHHRDPRAQTVFYARNNGRGGETGEHFGQMSDVRVRTLCEKYRKRAGIKKRVSPHMFRHALATNLLENGCPLPFVQKQLRHSRVETTMIYLHASSKAFRNNFDRFLPDYGSPA